MSEASDADEGHSIFSLFVRYLSMGISCYSEIVKNITVSLPDEIYRRARVRAAEKDTSVSSLVREFLMNLEESEFERLHRIQNEVLATIQHFDASERLTRDEVHDRDALR